MSKYYFTNYFKPNVLPEALKYWGKKKSKEKKSMCTWKKISKVIAARNYFPVLNLIVQKAGNELLDSAVKIFYFIMPFV